MPQDGCEAPQETAWFALTANRLARPASKVAGDERWLADEGYWPEAKPLALAPLYRALAVLLCHLESIEQELFCRTADLLNAAGDLLCGDTTTLSFELADEDDDGEVWHDQAIPALRKRGHNQAAMAPRRWWSGWPAPVMGCPCARGCFLATPPR
jgi:hypothetical protein